MSFQYRQLKDNEIRLLKPHPRSSDSLCYSIKHVSLASKPRYAALSYTWGPPGDAHHILLNGQRFSIRHNLHDALDQISGTKLVKQYLWVDAICINQAESVDALDERSIQITLMKQVYEQAGKVLVWLGLPANDLNNRLAFSLMEIYEKRYRRVMLQGRPYRPWWWQTKQRTSADDLADFKVSMSPSKDKIIYDVPGSHTYKAWLGIVSLYKSPWWTRTWVFQEATIPERWAMFFATGIMVSRSPSKVKFLCGDQQTSWHELAVTRFVAGSVLNTPEIDSQFLQGFSKNFEEIAKFREKRVQHNIRSLLDTIQSFRDTQCFDPRDKVYAPLCLASDDARRFLIPDYATKTVLDVYIDVARYCLTQTGHTLDFLGYTMYQGDEQSAETPQGVRSTFPSWVPNFSASLKVTPIPKVLFVPARPRQKGMTLIDRRGVPTNDQIQIAAYRPLGDMQLRSRIEGATLFVRGARIDNLKDKIANTGPDMATVTATAKATSIRWQASLNHRYFTGESYLDAYRRILLLDVVYDIRGNPSERGNTYDGALMMKTQAELTPTEYLYTTTMQTAQSNGMSSRDIGLSEKHYLLTIPNTAVAGDAIWALAGGQVLYMLRLVNEELNQYIFVGECYGHGLMDGEIVRQLHLGETKMEDISLI